MTQTIAARQSKQAKQRRIGVVAVEGDWFLFQIEAAGKLDYYLARKLEAEQSFGACYEIVKQDEQGDAATYHVSLGRHPSCSCPSGCFRPHKICRHVAGLQALAAHGKLPGYCLCRSEEEHEQLCEQPLLDATAA